MQRTIPTMIVVALVGVTAPATAGHDGLYEIAGGQIVLWGPDATTWDSQPQGAGGHDGRGGDGDPTTYTCSSTMHDMYFPSGSAYCNTGTHTRGSGPIGIGTATNTFMLTGMLEHVLSHASGEVRFQCSWTNGNFQGCRVASLSWPPVGATFCHEMWAHAGPPPGPFAPNGVRCETTAQLGPLVFTANAPPGGSGLATGSWEMSVTH